MAASRIMVARRGSRPTTAMLRLPSTNYAYINTPIRRLPNELLMEVFRIDYCACKRTNYCDPRRDSTCQWTYETVSTEWLRLLLVCRHWHTIACATAALWRSISASRKVRWLKLCLARSADMTVDVVLAWPRWSDRVLKAIVAKASHIRKLVIVVHEHDVSDDIDQLWRLQMPFLEELTFHAVVSADGFWPSVTCADFDSTAFPALRSLRLSNATFSLACPIVSQLHTLQLIYASTIKCWETEKVLQALEAIAQDGTLRHLELNRSYLPRERLAHIHPISLLKLESLVLIGYEHQHISNLLRHLHLGPDARIHLTLDSNLEAEWSEDQWLGLIDLIPPEDMQGLPILRTTSSVSIEFRNIQHRYEPERRELEFVCTAGKGRRGRLTILCKIQSHPCNGLEWQYTLDGALDDVCKIFADCPLAKLSLHEFSASDMRRASSQRLVQVFRKFPKLAVVEIKYNDRKSSCESLLQALSSESSSTEIEHNETPCPAQGNAEGAVLPRLRVLRIIQLPWREDVLPSLVRCLRQRALNGARLGDLRVELRGRPRGPEVEETHDAHILELQSLSTRVTYTDGNPFPGE